MQVDGLYGFVLMLVMVGFLVGLGVVAFDKITTSGVITGPVNGTPITNQTFQALRDEIGGISTDWFSLIVTIGVLVVILTMLIRSFGMKGR